MPASRPLASCAHHAIGAAAQPLVHRDGSRYGWELLARRPRRPLSEGAGPALAPIKAADEWLALDSYMLTEAAALALRDRGVRVLFNLSPYVMEDHRLCERFLDATAAMATAVGRFRLAIEVHESVNRERSHFNHFIDELHARGCLAALDDFHGTRTCWEKSCARWDIVKLDCQRMPSAQALAAIDVIKDGLDRPSAPDVIVEAVPTLAEAEALFAAGAHAIQSFASGAPRWCTEALHS